MRNLIPPRQRNELHAILAPALKDDVQLRQQALLTSKRRNRMVALQPSHEAR
jgi:hypothetical protein